MNCTMRRLLVLPMGLLFAACASVPAPATRSPQNQAHPSAPEAATPPASPLLMLAGHGEIPAPKEPAPHDMDRKMHGGHSMPGPASSPTASPSAYSCPMHPHVRSDKPGACPVCGMTLIKKEVLRPDGGDPR